MRININSILPLVAILFVILLAISRVMIWNDPPPTFGEFLVWLACWGSIILSMLWKVPPDKDGKLLDDIGARISLPLLCFELFLVVIIPIGILLYFYFGASYINSLPVR